MTQDVAVLLNAQARGVTPSVVRTITAQLPPESVFVSSSLDEAEAATHEIMSKGYRTVLTGGGDGTLVNFLNHSIEYIERVGEDGDYPLIGILKLGTGNGIGSYVGAEGYLPDLHKIVRSGWANRQRLSLIKVEGRYCHFSGFGLDAAILNDYLDVKNLSLRRGRFLTGPDVHATANVAVLGAGAAKRLFSFEDPLDEPLLLGPGAYRAVGVPDAQGRRSATPR